MRLLFDRGTLLLLDLPPGLDPTQLPGVLWDPRVGVFRAAAHRRIDLSRELTRRGAHPPAGVGCDRDAHGAVDRHRQAEAVLVVGVVPDEVHPARCDRDAPHSGNLRALYH